MFAISIVVIAPKRLIKLPSQPIVGLSQRRQTDNAPFFMVQSSPGQVVFVPSSLNEYLSRMRYQPRLEVVDVPVPDPIPDQFAIGVLA